MIHAEDDYEKSRHTESHIIAVFKKVDAAIKVEEACRQHSWRSASYYNWKSKYDGMEASDVERLKELEEENVKLKKMFADVSLENNAIKEHVAKKGWWQMKNEIVSAYWSGLDLISLKLVCLWALAAPPSIVQGETGARPMLLYWYN